MSPGTIPSPHPCLLILLWRGEGKSSYTATTKHFIKYYIRIVT